MKDKDWYEEMAETWVKLSMKNFWLGFIMVILITIPDEGEQVFEYMKVAETWVKNMPNWEW